MQANVEWLPALGMLGAGLAGGGAVAWFASRRNRGAAVDAAVEAQVEEREATVRRDTLIAQLRELDDTSSKETAEDLAARRYELELELARTLMELDELEGRSASVVNAPPVEERPESPMRGFAWGLGTVVAVGALFFFVSTMASKKETPAGPQKAAMTDAADGQANAEMKQLQEIIAANPNDFNARIALARMALAENSLMETFEHTNYILSIDPQHVPALSYQALVRVAMGQGDLAVKMLNQATSLDPSFIDGWVNLAIVHTSLGDLDAAQKAIDGAIAADPTQKEALTGLMGELRQQAASAPPMQRPPGDDPHAGIALPGVGEVSKSSSSDPANPHGDMFAATSPAETPLPAAANGQAAVGAISGTLRLDSSVASKVKTPAVVFLIAREAGKTSGPPVAVRRMEVSSFPVAFTLTGANAMMAGTALPAKVRVEARVDSDGDVTTKTGDPVGAIDGLAVGSKDAAIVIK
jgi:tetratricopeptide (TPR) repeat protein